MQYDPYARAAFPQMSMLRFTGNQSSIPEKKYNTLSNITLRALESKFGSDIGVDVKAVKFLFSAVEMKTTERPGSFQLCIRKFFEGLEDVTMDSIKSLTWRDGTAFVRLNLPSGVRLLVFNPLPFKFPARIFKNPETGSIDMEFVMVGAPSLTKFYLCFGELETYRCANCGICDDRMNKCSGCNTSEHCVRYCSVSCQSAHWSLHKPFCKKPESQ